MQIRQGNAVRGIMHLQRAEVQPPIGEHFPYSAARREEGIADSKRPVHCKLGLLGLISLQRDGAGGSGTEEPRYPPYIFGRLVVRCSGTKSVHL